MSEDTRFRVLQAEVTLNKYNHIWRSELSLRFKIRFLKSHVFPTLLYATECGNHTQVDLDMIETMLNKCRRRILNVGRRAPDGTVISNSELKRRCRLPGPLDLISRRRLNFASKLYARPSSTVARQLLYAELAEIGRAHV